MALHPTPSFSEFIILSNRVNIVLSITFCFLADLFGSLGSVQENEKQSAV